MRVLRAKKVRNVDTFGKSDPYTIVEVHDTEPPQEARTKIKDNTLNPEWNEEFEFVLCRKDEVEVEFTLKDDDIGKDQLLGEVKLNLDILPEDVLVQCSMPVIYKLQQKGTFQFEMEWKPFVDAEILAVEEKSGKKNEKKREYVLDDEGHVTSHVVYVHVSKCMNLSRIGPKLDTPHAVMFVDVCGKTKKATSARSTCSPTFGETLSFCLTEEDIHHEWSKVSFSVIHVKESKEKEGGKSKDAKKDLQRSRAQSESKNYLGRYHLPMEELLSKIEISGEFPLAESEGSMVASVVIKSVRKSSYCDPISLDQCKKVLEKQSLELEAITTKQEAAKKKAKSGPGEGEEDVGSLSIVDSQSSLSSSSSKSKKDSTKRELSKKEMKKEKESKKKSKKGDGESLLKVPHKSEKRRHSSSKAVGKELEVTESEEEEFVGTLLVELIDGENLLPVDKDGLSDPFVKVTVGKKKHKTKVIHDNLNPVWNQTLEFPINLKLPKSLTGAEVALDAYPRLDPKSLFINFHVMDKNKVSRSKNLGMVEMSLVDVLHQKLEKLSVSEEKKGKSSASKAREKALQSKGVKELKLDTQGLIRVKVMYTPAGYVF